MILCSLTLNLLLFSSDWDSVDFGEPSERVLNKYLSRPWPKETSTPSTSGLMSAGKVYFAREGLCYFLICFDGNWVCLVDFLCR